MWKKTLASGESACRIRLGPSPPVFSRQRNKHPRRRPGSFSASTPGGGGGGPDDPTMETRNQIGQPLLRDSPLPTIHNGEHPPLPRNEGTSSTRDGGDV